MLPYNHFSRGALWLSGRVSDSGARGRGFDTYRRRVVSLSKTLYSPWLITQEAWLRPDMTEKLLTGTLSLNTNKQPLLCSYSVTFPPPRARSCRRINHIQFTPPPSFRFQFLALSYYLVSGFSNYYLFTEDCLLSSGVVS